jgi:hypothetical protein
LGAFEDQHLEQAPIVMARDAHSSSWWRMLRGRAPKVHRLTRLINVGPSARARLVGGRPAYDLTLSRCR